MSTLSLKTPRRLCALLTQMPSNSLLYLVSLGCFRNAGRNDGSGFLGQCHIIYPFCMITTAGEGERISDVA